MFVVQNLTPPQLAGVLGAIMTGENISKPQVWAAYEPTPEVVNAVHALEGDREQLYKAQVKLQSCHLGKWSSSEQCPLHTCACAYSKFARTQCMSK